MIINGIFHDELFINGNIKKFIVPFELDIEINNGSFNGIVKDDQSKNCFEKDIIVKGFIEDDFISFTKKYPHDYNYDPKTDTFFADTKSVHPGIVYEGRLDKIDNKFKGHWFMKINEVKENLFQTDFFIDDEVFGEWEMENKFNLIQ